MVVIMNYYEAHNVTALIKGHFSDLLIYGL